MIAIEVTGRISHGQVMLSNPPPSNWEGRQVRAIIMSADPSEDESKASEAIRTPQPLPPPLAAPDFAPLPRDDIYDRS